MEQLHSKVHENYKNLKKRKLLEEDADQKKNSSKMQNYQQDVQDLFFTLKSENERLYGEMSSLKEKNAENEKLVLEHTKKTKVLLSEVAMLQDLLAKKDEKVEEANQNVTPGKMPRLRRSTCVQEESDKNAVPSCCRTTLDNDGDKMMKDSISCLLHTVLVTVVGMTVSIDSQSKEDSCLSVTHERSGYAFSLTWTKNRGELMYRVSSLGMLEEVAVHWMKEEIIFSMSMCRMFFERLAHIIGSA